MKTSAPDCGGDVGKTAYKGDQSAAGGSNVKMVKDYTPDEEAFSPGVIVPKTIEKVDHRMFDNLCTPPVNLQRD
jgi:hypothetical protein